MIQEQVHRGPGSDGSGLLQAFERPEEGVGGAVPPRRLERDEEAPGRSAEPQPRLGERGAGARGAERLQAPAIGRGDPDDGVQTEAVERSAPHLLGAAVRVGDQMSRRGGQIEARARPARGAAGPAPASRLPGLLQDPGHVGSAPGRRASMRRLRVVLCALIGLSGLALHFASARLHLPPASAHASALATLLVSDDGTEKRMSGTLQIATVFPFPLGPPLRWLYFDPDDRDIVWLAVEGGVIQYNLDRNRIERLMTGADGIDGYPNAVVRKNRDLFVSTNGGFRKINLDTGARTSYGESDGLVNGANVRLVADPSDDRIIWVATFDGLSRFDHRDGAFTNFRGEIGIQGRSVHVRDVKAGSRFVWVVVHAHAHSQGGVARYDKATERWRAWGPEAFGKSGRLDIQGFDADDARAFLSVTVENTPPTQRQVSSRIYAYAPSSDRWEILSEQVGVPGWVSYVGEGVYFVRGVGSTSRVEYLDLKSKGRKILTGSRYDRVYADRTHERLLLARWPREIALYRPGRAELTKLIVAAPDDLRVSDLLSSTGDRVLLRGWDKLLVYELAAQVLREVPSAPLDAGIGYLGRILGEVAVVVGLSEGYGREGDDTKVLAVSLPRLRVERTVTLKGQGVLEAFIGSSLSEIFLWSRERQQVFLVDLEKGRVEKSALAITELRRKFGRDGEPIVRTSPADFSVMLDPRLHAGDRVRIAIRRGPNEPWVPRAFEVGEAAYSPFGPPTRWVRVTDVKFDERDPGAVWIGTDRGLIRYDFRADRADLFTPRNGLGHPVVESVFPGDKLVVKHPTGTYIYNASGR